METVFNHGIIPEELEELGYSAMSEEEYLDGMTDNTAMSDISDLYFLRGNTTEGNKFKKMAEEMPMAGLNDYLDFDE